MEKIKAPKKERKFLKAMGDIGLTLFRELVLGIGKKLINKVGNKRQGLVIAFALVASISYAAIDSIPYPLTGNKQRLGFQTTGNGLVYRGRSQDTITKPSSYVDKNVKAYLLLDSVRGTIFVWRQTFWDSLIIGGGVATPFDTSSLNLVNRFAEKLNIADTSILNLQSRFDLKLNLSDTAAMLLPYATKSYVDTAGRFYARQDYLNVTSSTLTWTQTDTLVPSGVNVVMVYRNGQILLTSQYTIPTKTSVVIAASSFKVGENYTVIFPKGGGGSGGSGGGGGGSGSVTSISQGTGIIATPNPIVSTGSIAADTSFLVTRFDTLSMLLPYLRKLDTASLSTRIDAKGSGTVTSVGNGYGLLSTQLPITTSGVLRVDSATVYDFVRDSIVAVEIGGDTIKIIKQEYEDVTSDTLTFTILPKFPIQLRQFILLFRNGQLLLNDQFTVIDTNKIKIAASSFKLGENYTLVTVSGIGSVGSAQAGNPVYPEAGIALSSGTTWQSSIPNNSSNWNTAFTDRYKWDGGSTNLVPSTGRTSLGGTTIGQSMFTLTNPSAITFPRFNANNTVTARSAVDFRTDIGAGTGNGNGTVTSVIAAATAGNPVSITLNTTTPTIELLSATSGRNGYLTSTDWTTFNNKFSDTSLLNLTSRFAAKQNTLTNPVTGTGTTNTLPLFTGASAIGNSVIQESSGNIGIGTSPIANLTFDVNKNILLKSGSTGIASLLFSELGTPSATDVEFGGILRYNGSLDRMELLTRDNLGGSNVTNTGLTMERISGNIGLLKPVSMSSTLAVTDATTLSNLSGTGTRMVVASSTGLLSTQTIPSGGGGTGTVTSVTGTGTVNGISLSGTGTTAVTLTLGGVLSNVNLTSQVTGALPILNGGTGATTADGALTNLGATVVGKSLFGLTNSVSDKFIKVNANNTITMLNAADTRTAIGAGTGTVTNVTASSPIFSSGGTTPNISMTAAGINVSGFVSHDGTQIFTGNKSFLGQTTMTGIAFFKDYTYQATRLAGLSSTDRFATVTLGSTLSLSNGVLNAIIGGVTSVTASTPLSSSGGATPNITITDAGTGASGVVNTTTQSFAGNKTFTGDVIMQNDIDNREGYIRRKYVAGSAATYIVLDNDTWIRWGRSDLVTFTLPSAASYPGREIYILNIGNGSITSNATNIQQLDGSQNSQITGAGPGKWCTLVSTGSTYWQKMAGN